MSDRIVTVDLILTPAPEPSEWAPLTTIEIIEDMLSVSPLSVVRKLLEGTPAFLILEHYVATQGDAVRANQ
jgi:hypothetical protein